jgi:hypothetical protein
LVVVENDALFGGEDKRVDEWFDERSSIREDPLDKVSVYRTRASEYHCFALRVQVERSTMRLIRSR